MPEAGFSFISPFSTQKEQKALRKVRQLFLYWGQFQFQMYVIEEIVAKSFVQLVEVDDG